MQAGMPAAGFNFSKYPHLPRRTVVEAPGSTPEKMKATVEHALPDQVRMPTEALEGSIRKGTNMKRATLLAVAMACSATLSWPTFAADNMTAKFVKNAAIGGMFEVQSSKAALTKAQDPKIKHLAQMLIDDHSAANEKLKKIAAKEDISVPSQLDTKHQGQLDTLRETKGSFAQPYIQMQRKAHEEAITLFKRYADHGDDAALKSFAKSTLPTLEKHQDAIQKIWKDMKSG